MKKISVAACVCVVLFSFGMHGEGMREVSAKTPGAEENLAILQDRKNWQRHIRFYRMGQLLMQEALKFMPLFRGMIAGSVSIRLRLRKKGNIRMI